MVPAPGFMAPGWLPRLELIEWPSLDAMREEHERLLVAYLQVSDKGRLLELGAHVALAARTLTDALYDRPEGELLEGIRVARVAAGLPPDPSPDEKPTMTAEERLHQAFVYTSERAALARDFREIDHLRDITLSAQGTNVLVGVEQLSPGLSGDSSAQALVGMVA